MLGHDMADTNNQIPIRKRKMKRKMPTEEVVIKIGESPKVDEEGGKPQGKKRKMIAKGKPKEKPQGQQEEIIDIEKELDELEGEEEEIIEVEEEPEDDFDLEEEPEEEEVEDEEEAGEEVIVISLGTQPEEEEGFAEEEVELGEEEEVEVKEDVEPEKLKEKRKPLEKEERKKRMKIAAVIIAIIVIISAIGIYFLFFLNQEPVAELHLSLETALEGQIVFMDGSNSSDDKKIVEYSWDFGDKSDIYFETSEFASDGEFDGITTHAYDTKGEYTVKFTVTDEEEKTASAEAEITITELEVMIPFEKIGDRISYNIHGFVEVDDNSGLGTWNIDEGSIKGSITVENIYIEYSGYMISSIIEIVNEKDGFGETHKTLEKWNYEDVELWGNITGVIDAGGIPFNHVISFEDGYLRVSDNAYIDLNTNKTIYSVTNSDFEVSVFEEDITSNDTIRSYSNLREGTTVFRVEDLKDDRNFKKEDSDIRRVGDILYDWEVTKAQNVKGYPALKIEISIDSNTMTQNNIEEFEMALWIANGIPQPVKTYIYTKIDSDGTEITAEYNNEIQVGGFTRGSDDIEYYTCPATSLDDHYHFRNPNGEFVAWESGDEIPDMGGNQSSLDDYTPQQAISLAKTNSAGLQNYLDDHNDAYIIDGYFNDTQDDPPLWNITFGEKGEETAYYVVVQEGGSIRDESQITVSKVENSTLDFDPVLSFSSGEQVFLGDEDVDDNIYMGASEPAWYNGVNYGAKTDIIYPTISLTISLTIERTGYGYYINKDDGTFFSAVDAINGQLIYVWVHRGDDIVTLILGGI
jgi:hypothetical protein